MANIDFKYEQWKNKLLDLGKRNRLLNYRDTARSNVKITYPDCVSLYDMFVRNEGVLYFPYEISADVEDEVEYYPNVETNKSVSDLQKALRNIRNKAKTAIEEQGINVLYLSFGFLKWTEAEHSDHFFTAPLILVPVTLSIESITSPYELSLHEDEIILNPTLVYKLENEFGITLPTFEDADDIGDFFDKVNSKINLNTWSVSKEVGLSLLSFLKINMYFDLNSHQDTITSNPIVRALSGDASALTRIPEEYNDYDFDKNEKPLDVFQVVDADASQQDAILLAKKGVSFVLQGPPGTGKSQTITNIIAECLADGKKVLFVSEKMAALDVVHHRLASAGLDDFCLVLHSYKANKKSVLEQLGKVLNLSGKKASLSDEVYQKLNLLQADKNKLNEYANQVYQVIEPLNKSIYEVNGIIANLDAYDELIFSIEDIRNVSNEQYNKYNYLIHQFASTIGKMTNDYNSNPWRDSNLLSVSNEFRHDATAMINSLLPKIKNFDKHLANILIDLHLDLPRTLNSVDSIINIIEVLNNSYKIPQEWITTEELQPFFDELSECASHKELILEKLSVLDDLYRQLSSCGHSIPVTVVENLKNVDALINEKNNLVDFLNTKVPFSKWNEKGLDAIEHLLIESEKVANDILRLKDNLLEVYEPAVFELDYMALLGRIKTEYTSFLKIFKKEYKQDKKTIQLYHKNIVKKITDGEMISLVEKLRTVDETRKWFEDNAASLSQYFDDKIIDEDADFVSLKNSIHTYKILLNVVKEIGVINDLLVTIESKENTLKEHYQFLYEGVFSDWAEIEKALKWALILKEKLNKVSLSDEFISKICNDEIFINTCLERKTELEELKRNIRLEFDWFISNFNDINIFMNSNLSNMYDRLSKCINGLFLLEEWIDFSAAKKKCIINGLEDFVNVIEQNSTPVENIIPIFMKRFFRLWLDAVLPEFPAVLNFRRKMQESTIDEFASLDKIQFEIAKARIKSKLINELPSLERFTNGVDEISILKRELSKQRRIMPIRRLFKAIPNLLLTLKPCLMMSPLSVSLFLEAESYKFDIIIFDEASQVCTENAIGAISRAKQVVIAGDSKQLPPTNFFQSALNEGDFDNDEDDEFDDADAYESILDEANMLPERTLRWHYRSRHESLIAFSNTKIYHSNLITFPSNIEQSENNGVEYIYVPDGYYDRGGKKGNVIEANKIADLVFKHFKEKPNRSLGVIAFGEVQQQAIETIIRERRLRNQSFEAFFAEDREEAFFVKNLENVQGDERDTIIFSIGYAKDANGVFRMNFGPLSKSGGERRLNVAITRAKYNVKLVGSILPTDIDIDKITSQGPKLLRGYIDFAINGADILAQEITESDIAEHDSPFEEAVYNFLDKKGYKLATQVGCSGYRIDIAVKHPALSGVYVLGIECDGATYHSARTARERDRLRQDVLENMGWTIYRIWSTDWIKDPITEGQKLIDAIDNVIINYGYDERQQVTEFQEEQSGTSTDLLDVEVSLEVEENSNPYGFEEAKITSFSHLPRNRFGYLELTDCIMEAVNTEFPIHYELLCQRLAYLYGNEKATIKVRREVDYGLNKLGNKVVIKNDFIFPKDYDVIPVRMPNERKIQHISIEELAAAMLKVLQVCVGITKDGLCTETTKVYGFNRAGQNISKAMSSAFNILLQEGKIEVVEEKVHLLL